MFHDALVPFAERWKINMNICIVTVYNSENCGSYLQAYALAKTIEKFGHDVYFMKRSTKGTSHDFFKVVVECTKLILRGKFIRAKERWQSFVEFSKMTVKFKVIQKKDVLSDMIDVVVIGSDTLWNFDDSYFYDRKEIYSGYTFLYKNAISYASSIANTKYETLMQDDTIMKGIRNLKEVSVRDAYTRNVVESIVNSEVVSVLDPTFLLKAEEYGAVSKNCTCENYILLYCFKEPDKEVRKKIQELKLLTGEKIVSFGNYREWADINIPFNPGDFLGYFSKASAIITDTYHGTVFSIIYEKNFVCLGQHKNKVKDILISLDLENRFLYQEDSLIEKFNKTIDYESVEKKLDNFRNTSIKYLKDSFRKLEREDDRKSM